MYEQYHWWKYFLAKDNPANYTMPSSMASDPHSRSVPERIISTIVFLMRKFKKGFRTSRRVAGFSMVE